MNIDPGKFETWLFPKPEGLYCAPADAYIDPYRPVPRAVITHGHADHARPGHDAVLATPETIAIMKTRMGEECAGRFQGLPYGEVIRIGDVDVHLHPAGHVLGSAQVVLDYKGQTAVVSGDYKRQRDPTCEPFDLVRCDLFVTEATFGLPVFRHGDAAVEVQKLLRSLQDFPERTHLVGVYGLGKCQRLIRHIRDAGYDRTIWLHGAMVNVTQLYQDLGVELGACRHVSDADDKLPGEIVMCPPSALQDRWSRRLTDPVTIFASGWMRVRGRARQRGVELPLIVSDHVDWPDLIQTIRETEAREVWVTHGREDALVRQLELMQLRGRALRLVGRDEEEEA